MKKRKPNKKQYAFRHKVDKDGNLFCNMCKEWKLPADFHKNRCNESGREHRCKKCKKLFAIQALYGITIAEYDALFEKQGGKCAICGNSEVDLNKGRLCIDHNHKTNKVRGILCTNCNTALGSFKDDIHLLLKAVEYLQQ